MGRQDACRGSRAQHTALRRSIDSKAIDARFNRKSGHSVIQITSTKVQIVQAARKVGSPPNRS
jgi:hypothetical protein